MRLLALLVLLGSLLSASTMRHDFFVSITEIHQKHDTLQIAMKLFTDDLERAINEHRDEKVFLESKTDMKLARKVVAEYLDPHFTVSIAARPMKTQWLGHEYVEDVCWAYAQVILPADAGIAFVRNTVLTDVIPGQQNIVHFQSDDDFEKLLCNKSRPEIRVLLKKEGE